MGNYGMEERGSKLVRQDKEGALEGSVVVCDRKRTRLARHRPRLHQQVKVHNNVTAVSCTGKELCKPIRINKKTHISVSTIS